MNIAVKKGRPLFLVPLFSKSLPECWSASPARSRFGEGGASKRDNLTRFHLALYTMRCPKPFWSMAVQASFPMTQHKCQLIDDARRNRVTFSESIQYPSLGQKTR
jgi:hypothetical protein